MEEQKSFKNRVAGVLISTAPLFENYFVQYEYLLCSPAFVSKPYYIVSAYGDNFKHLTGVQTELSAGEFYKKALEGLLCEDDFNFIKKGQTEKQVKGTVRKKIKVLTNIINIFSEGTMVQEDFSRNRVCCSFAAGRQTFTLGFTVSSPAKPMTLLEGDELDAGKAMPLEMVLRRHKGCEKFEKMVVGDKETMCKYIETVRPLISEDLLNIIL